MQISLKLIRLINHAKITVCIKFQLLVTFSSLFTGSSSLSVFPRSVLYTISWYYGSILVIPFVVPLRISFAVRCQFWINANVLFPLTKKKRKKNLSPCRDRFLSSLLQIWNCSLLREPFNWAFLVRSTIRGETVACITKLDTISWKILVELESMIEIFIITSFTWTAFFANPATVFIGRAKIAIMETIPYNMVIRILINETNSSSTSITKPGAAFCIAVAPAHHVFAIISFFSELE